MSVLERAAAGGATPEQLERMLELTVRADEHALNLMREKRRMDEEDRKLAAALAFRRDFAAFRGENIVVPKGKHVDRGRAGSFWQAEFHSIAQLLSPALSRHGFSFRHDQRFGIKEFPTAENPNAREGWVWVTCYLEHRDGHAEVMELEGPTGDQSANTPVQNMQLTASYLKRQSLLAITGTATGGEDDENGMRAKPKRRGEDPGADDGAPDESEALVNAGRQAAMSGMTALNKWWSSLTPRQQKDMGQDFGAMRKAARIADEAVQR
jgi:hypothetical protein